MAELHNNGHWYPRWSKMKHQIDTYNKLYRLLVNAGRALALFMVGVLLAVLLGLGVLGIMTTRVLFTGVLVKTDEKVYTVAIDRGTVRIQERR